MYRSLIIILFIGIIIHCFGAVNANPYQDSLLLEISSGELSFEDEYEALTDLGFTYYGYDSDQLFKYAKQALDLAIEHQDQYRIGMANMLMGIGYIHTSEYYLSTLHFEKSLKTFQELDRPKEVIKVYNNLAVVKQELGDYEQAIYYLLEALKQAELLKSPKDYIPALNNLGLAYQDFKEYDKAMHQFRLAEEIALEERDSAKLKSIRINLIDLYILLDNYEDAFSAIDDVFPYILKTNDLFSEISIYEGLFTLHKKLGHYEKALEYAQKALDLAKQTNNVKKTSIALNNLGIAHTYLGNYEIAEDYLIRNFDSLKDSELVENQLYNLETLVFYYKTTGDFEKAFEYNEKHQALNDSILNRQKEIKIAALESQYDNHKKEETIATLQKDQRISQLNQRLLGLGLIVALLLGGFIGYVQHTRTKRQNQRIKDEQVLNKQLQESHDTKVRFFTNISHELRTPLTLIQGPLELMKDKIKPSFDKEEVKLMYRNSKRLQQLINQILEISRIESGLVMLNFTKMPILKFIRQTSEVFIENAIKNDIEININIPEDQLEVYADEDKLIKIVTNLLSNAIKYNRKNGQVTVSVSLDSKDYLKIEIADTGIGIDPKELDHIFDRFYMAKPDANENSSGIGLSLVKELISLYEGTIEVMSEVGKGTKFSIRLPVNPNLLQSDKYQITDYSGPDEWVAAEDVKGEGTTDGNMPSILIVEDNKEIRQYIKKNLSDRFQLLEAENGKEGVDVAIDKIPDLIITDIMMPIMDGVSFTQKLKNERATDHIPIIMLTAKGEMDAKLKGYETGADDYIPKPFNMKELMIRIDNLIKQRTILKEKFSKLITVGVGNIEAKSKDEIFLAKALEVVEQHYTDHDFTAEQFMKEIAMSRMQLHRKLKALTGFSTTEFIRSIRLKKAHQLIEKESGNINEIAYQVGFTDPSYFTKCFRNFFGYSPSQLAIKKRVVLDT